jgi:hypothetical protein
MGILARTIRLLVGIKDALNKLEKTISRYQESEDRKEKEKVPTELKARVSLPVEVTSYYEAEQRERGIKNRHETYKRRVEYVGVGAAIILAILTFCTLITLKGQLKAMQQQTCIQREGAINQERAWVGLSQTPQIDIGSLSQPQFNAQINLQLRNFGKGPAFNVFSDSELAVHGHVEETLTTTCNLIFPFVGLTPTRPVGSSEDVSKHQWGQMIFPNQDPLNNGNSWTAKSSDILGQEVFVVGCIVYKDQFERPHWTKFSYSTGPFITQVVRDASSFRHLYVSSANNYTDDAEKKQSCPN